MNTLQIPYQLLADLIVLVHVGFVVFAVWAALGREMAEPRLDSCIGCYLGCTRRSFRLGVPFDAA